MLFSNENHLLQPVIYVTKKIFVKIQRCLQILGKCCNILNDMTITLK